MRTTPLILGLTTTLLLGGTARVMAQSSGFTYQGRLADGGSPATGLYDLKFALVTSENGGPPVGLPGTNSLAAVPVTNGLFTVTLDFGAAAFTGPARWLEIGVRTNGGSGDFTTLTPRQPITPTPYALFAGKAAMLDENAGQTFTGTIGFNPSTPGAPPFAVTSAVKVNNLNADLFDGLDSTNFLLKSEHCLKSIAELKARDAGFVPCVTVLGYYAPGDGGGGNFYWDSSSTEPDNGGTMIQKDGLATGRWRRFYSGPLNVRWFGAKGDGTTNDIRSNTVAIRSAIQAAPVGGTVFVPAGTYHLTRASTESELLLLDKKLSIVGEGNFSILMPDASVPASVDVIRIRPPYSGYDLTHCRLAHFMIAPPTGTLPCRHGVFIDVHDVSTNSGDPRSVSYHTIESLDIRQLGGNAIKQQARTNQLDTYFASTIRDCQLQGGIDLENAGDSIRIERCTLWGAGLGIRLQQGFRTLPDYQFASEALITDCNITSSAGSIRVISGNHVKILRNNIEQFRDWSGAAVFIEGLHPSEPASRVRMCEIRGNYIAMFDRSWGSVLAISGADHAIVEHNTLVSDGPRAEAGSYTRLNITAAADDTRVLNNFFSGSPVGGAHVNVSDLGAGTAGVPRVVATAGTTEPFLRSPWANASGYVAGFFKSCDQIVTLKGALMRTGTPTPNETIFTLPVEFRPAETKIFAVICSGSTVGEVRVMGAGIDNGQIRWIAGSPANYLALDGVSFKAER